MVRRLWSISSVCLVAATVTVVTAQPKKPAPKTPVAPAKDAAPATPAPTPDAGSGSAAGSAVEPEEPPPKDIEGRDENPADPNAATTEQPAVVTPVKKTRPAGYPIEEALRPITLPQNMSEVSIAPHAQLGDYRGFGYMFTDALRARYGITRRVQLGFTYVLGGVYNDNAFDATAEDKLAANPGKALGFDLTVLLQNWIGVRVGVPVYLKPVAYSLQLGVPMRFYLLDKLTVGGFDDLLNIKLSKFAPSFYHEGYNAQAEFLDSTNSAQSDGQLRFSTYAIYQQKPKVALIGRFGLEIENFSSRKTEGTGGGMFTFLRAGVQWTPRRWVDLGVSLGFDDLADLGSFGPAGFLAFRI